MIVEDLQELERLQASYRAAAKNYDHLARGAERAGNDEMMVYGWAESAKQSERTADLLFRAVSELRERRR